MGPMMLATTRSLRFLWLTLCLALFSAPGCGGKSSAPPAPETKTAASEEGKSSTTEVPPVEDDEEYDRALPDPRGKSWEGWRWKGKRDNCYFIVENQCFADKDAACKAAECDSGCAVGEGAPAKVTCKELKE